jgi:hypothetical protein
LRCKTAADYAHSTAKQYLLPAYAVGLLETLTLASVQVVVFLTQVCVICCTMSARLLSQCCAGQAVGYDFAWDSSQQAQSYRMVAEHDLLGPVQGVCALPGMCRSPCMPCGSSAGQQNPDSVLRSCLARCSALAQDPACVYIGLMCALHVMLQGVLALSSCV